MSRAGPAVTGMSSVARAGTLRLTLAVLLSVAAVLAAQPPQSKPRQISLESLDRVDDLRASFNNDRRQVRLVLLLSPT